MQLSRRRVALLCLGESWRQRSGGLCGSGVSVEGQATTPPFRPARGPAQEVCHRVPNS